MIQKIALFHALKKKDLSTVRAIVAEDASLLSSSLGYLGLYPIHVAVQVHDLVMIDYLIDQGIDLNTVIDAPGHPEHEKTPLYFAVELGHMDLIQKLLMFAHKPANSDAFLLLHAAAQNGRLDIMEYLFEEYFDRNLSSLMQTDSTGQMPVHVAARYGHVNILYYYQNIRHQMYSDYDDATEEIRARLFFDQNLGPGAELNLTGLPYHLKKDRERSTLNLAVEHGQLDCVKMLMDNDISFKPEFETKARLIHVAAWYGHLDIVKYCIHKNPSALNEEDGVEHTPLLWALDAGHTEVVDYLFSLGADCNKEVKRGKHAGQSLLSLAVRGGHTSIVKRLIDVGAAVHVRITNMNFLLIHIAAREGHLETIRFLLEKYPRWLNETDVFEQTPLMWAASVGHVEVVQYLLSLNPNLNQATDTHIQDHPYNGKTARDWAVKHKHAVIVERLDAHMRRGHPEKALSYYKPAYIKQHPFFFEHESILFGPNKTLGTSLGGFVTREGQDVVVETLQLDSKNKMDLLERQVSLMRRAYPKNGFYASFQFRSSLKGKQQNIGRIVSSYLTGESADTYLQKIHSIDALVHFIRLMTKELARLHDQLIVLTHIELKKIIVSSHHDELSVTYSHFKYARDINDRKMPVAPDGFNGHFAPELRKTSHFFSLQFFSTLKPSYAQDSFSFGHLLNEIIYSHPLGLRAAESLPSLLAFIHRALDLFPENRPTLRSLNESLESDCLISTLVDEGEWVSLDSMKESKCW